MKQNKFKFKFKINQYIKHTKYVNYVNILSSTSYMVKSVI